MVIIPSPIEFGLLIFNHKEGGSVSLLVINLEIKIVDCFDVALLVSQELNLHEVFVGGLRAGEDPVEPRQSLVLTPGLARVNVSCPGGLNRGE